MKVLVTGSLGYLGSVLVPELQRRGHDVVGLDTGYYQAGWLYHTGQALPPTTVKDVRDVERADVAGVDAVVHMAELSNDPLAELDRSLTFDVNHRGSVRLAEIAKAAGVRRFVYMSSCSVYGMATGDEITEESPVNPLTAYAEAKVLVERDLHPMADDSFSPTFLRNATVFGASPRMRFDLVLNNLAGSAWTTGRIAMTSDGTPWRPLVHCGDIASCISTVLEAERDVVHDETFNVGDPGQNYQVREIAETVAEAFPGCDLSFGAADPDNRSYRVNFDKLAKALPEFRCERSARHGADELRRIFERVQLTAPFFQSPNFTRVKRLRYLLDSGQVDARLRWAEP